MNENNDLIVSWKRANEIITSVYIVAILVIFPLAFYNYYFDILDVKYLSLIHISERMSRGLGDVYKRQLLWFGNFANSSHSNNRFCLYVYRRKRLSVGEYTLYIQAFSKKALKNS